MVGNFCIKLTIDQNHAMAHHSHLFPIPWKPVGKCTKMTLEIPTLRKQNFLPKGEEKKEVQLNMQNVL